MVFSLTACGGGNKKALAASKEAYKCINDAYTMVEKYGDDIYEAWRMGIYDSDDDEFSLSYMAKQMNLSESELKMGMVYLTYESEWDTMTEQDKQEKVKQADSMFALAVLVFSSTFSMCVEIVKDAYLVSGKTNEITGLLDSAKDQMKILSEQYSNYEHYPSLKGYYTTTTSFFEFCKNPTGNFDQIKTTINDYRNSARDYKSSLDYIFN